MEYIRGEEPSKSNGVVRKKFKKTYTEGSRLKPAVDPSLNKLGMRELLAKLVEEKESGDKKDDTKQTKKYWKFPSKWTSKAKKSSKMKNAVLVFYLNIKGELEQPMIVPIYGGNMVVIKDKVYEVDPRAIWTVNVGVNKIYKLLIIKEIDRRPVSNLDWDDIRRRGDATDSDEFLIKAALKAQVVQATKKAINKGILILIGVAAVAAVIFFLMR